MIGHARNVKERTREERERTRERERGRESDKETQIKEEKPSEETKEVKIEKWVPPIKEGHISGKWYKLGLRSGLL